MVHSLCNRLPFVFLSIVLSLSASLRTLKGYTPGSTISNYSISSREKPTVKEQRIIQTLCHSEPAAFSPLPLLARLLAQLGSSVHHRP
jgi:hypothetical protein